MAKIQFALKHVLFVLAIVAIPLIFLNTRQFFQIPDSILGQVPVPEIFFPTTNSSRMGDILPFRPQGDTCLSRIQHNLYPGSNNYKPSDYLITKLRDYEQLHARCFKQAEKFAQVLASGGNITSSSDCKFIVWLNYQGMGNKMLTLASAFTYALLTNRVLLVDRGTDMTDLFCEPFPKSSWFVPKNFPTNYFNGMNEGAPNRFGRLLEAAGDCKASRKVDTLPGILYVHVTHNSKPEDKRFFCEKEQQLVNSHASWIFMRADVYYVPQMYFVPSFAKELDKLFPDHETIFRYTARYLFHPSNKIWSRITRFYDGYLRSSQNDSELVGLQIRTFDTDGNTVKTFSDQLTECIYNNDVLPNVSYNGEERLPRKALQNKKPVARDIRVLVVSLQLGFYDNLKDRYINYPAQNNSRVKFHFVSHEGRQQTDAGEHDYKVLTEIYLLAMCDELVTSPRSTFGYVANGLAGLRPWTLKGVGIKPWGGQWPLSNTPSCYKMKSVEPCYILGPNYDCDCKGDKPAPDGVKSCQDFPLGIKFDSS